MRSTRTPYRGIFSHISSMAGTAGQVMGAITALAGNMIPLQSATNVIVIPRDGWYRFTIDSMYQNSAGGNWYTQILLNGTNVVQPSGNQNVVATAPVATMSRNLWCKAGDRVQTLAAHSENSAVVRNIMGNLYIDEMVQ